MPLENLRREIKGLTEQNGRYYVVRRDNGKPVRHKLSRTDQGDDACRAAYAQLAPTTRPITVGDLLKAYIASGMDLLSDQTKADYRYRALSIITKVIDGKELKTGLMHFFGPMRIGAVKPSHISQYLYEARKLGRGTSANRDRAVLSSTFNFGMCQTGWGVDDNPCAASAGHGKARRNREKPSRRYIETDELIDNYGRACAALQILLNAAYLSGFRQIDLIKMERTQMTPEGLLVTESKTGHRRIMQWKPGVYEVFRRAIAFGDAIAQKLTIKLPVERPLPTRIFVNMRGKPWTKWGITSAMRRADATFPFRQLRAKAVTDGKDKNVVGHTGQMLKRYTRREVLEPLA